MLKIVHLNFIFFEKERIKKIFNVLTDLTKKDKNFVSNYKEILSTQIKNDSKYMNLTFGGFQVLSIGMLFVSFINLFKGLIEIIGNEDYYQLILIVIPIVVSYLLMIAQIKINRIKNNHLLFDII